MKRCGLKSRESVEKSFGVTIKKLACEAILSHHACCVSKNEVEKKVDLKTKKHSKRSASLLFEITRPRE